MVRMFSRNREIRCRGVHLRVTGVTRSSNPAKLSVAPIATEAERYMQHLPLTGVVEPAAPSRRAPLKADLCMIGGGHGGPSVAVGAVQKGVSIVPIEEPHGRRLPKQRLRAVQGARPGRVHRPSARIRTDARLRLVTQMLRGHGGVNVSWGAYVPSERSGSSPNRLYRKRRRGAAGGTGPAGLGFRRGKDEIYKSRMRTCGWYSRRRIAIQPRESG